MALGEGPVAEGSASVAAEGGSMEHGANGGGPRERAARRDGPRARPRRPRGTRARGRVRGGAATERSPGRCRRGEKSTRRRVREGGKRGAAATFIGTAESSQWGRCRTNKVHRSAAPFRSGEKENLARDPSSARSGIPRSAAAIREKNGDWTNCVPVDRPRQPNLTRRPREDRALTWCLLRTTGGDDTDNKVLPRARLGRAPVGGRRRRVATVSVPPRGAPGPSPPSPGCCSPLSSPSPPRGRSSWAGTSS